ncbi:hypothetical protein C2E21_6537 [Chlorella sorokiniana]|uniref:Uncharacterized protein n=1 Tax=Chlorella sorokiniana TaxID=3076 RepID=A0A2P6TKD2_CHLSO|nr:hypothetical protein C2E21_6537 [Chlorella sorokiniana]|eukprot:PRW44540.1 hypothetical protein C2E21_6537 [Chlorella sorokiniana]
MGGCLSRLNFAAAPGSLEEIQKEAQHNTLNDHKAKPAAGPPQRLTTEQRVMGTTNEDTWT